jgi:hypothetical protein
MSKAISFKDVIKCLNYLGHEAVSEIHLLPKSMDETVKPILHELGMDITKDFYVKANKHRTLDDDIYTGYRYIGTVRTDREWINSAGCDVMERVSITSFIDVSLTKELCELMGNSVNIVDADGSFYLEQETDRSLIVETYERDSMLIKQLDEICKQVRGWD